MAIPSAVAYSPGSVTCFFRPGLTGNPSTTFSRGCAITLDHGVSAAVRPAPSRRSYLNGRPVRIDPVDHVLDALAPEPVEVWFETPLPLGCGFGVSAACCLAAAFALGRRFDLPLSRHDLGMAAHIAEVNHRTGLGDVAAQLCGGVVYRRCQLGPLDCLPVDLSVSALYYRVFGDIATAKILQSAGMMRLIMERGEEATEWLKGRLNDVTLGEIFDRSLDFDRRVGLLQDPEVVGAIEDVCRDGGHALMILLGRSVLATRPAGDGQGWTACRVDQIGTRWLP